MIKSYVAQRPLPLACSLLRALTFSVLIPRALFLPLPLPLSLFLPLPLQHVAQLLHESLVVEESRLVQRKLLCGVCVCEREYAPAFPHSLACGLFFENLLPSRQKFSKRQRLVSLLFKRTREPTFAHVCWLPTLQQHISNTLATH